MSRRTGFTDARLLELVQLVYAAALDDQQWGTFLNALPDVFGGTGALLIQHDMVGHGQVSWSSNLDPAGLAEYQNYYHQVDPWATSGYAKRRAVAGSIMPDELLLPRKELKRTEFFGFVQRNDMARVMVSTINRDRELFSGLSVYRSERDASFDDNSQAFMKELLPHVAQALHIHHRLAGLSARLSATAEVLDHLPTAMFFVDADVRVVLMNRAAEQLIAASDGLRFADGELRASSPAATRRLRTAVSDASALTAHESLREGSYVSLPRQAGRPLQVRVAPVASGRASSRFIVPEVAVACLFVVDPDAEMSALRVEAFQHLFPLTPAEARVAAKLADGLTPQEVARALGLTLNTVRWYVKQISAKVGVSTQAQLVRTLLRTPVPW